jgi:hypothetical protein
MSSTYPCLPCEGNLEDVIHVCAYLALNQNVRVVFDPTYPYIYMRTFIKTYWKSMYGDMKEMITSDDPVPRVKEVDLRLFFFLIILVRSSQGVQGLHLLST